MQSPRHGTRQAARDIEPRRVGEQGYLPEGEGDNHRRYGRGGTKEDDEDEDDGKGGMAENMDESIAKRLIMAGELPSFRFHPQVYLRSDFVTYRLTHLFALHRNFSPGKNMHRRTIAPPDQTKRRRAPTLRYKTHPRGGVAREIIR